MRRFLIRQALFMPLAAMLIPMLVGLFLPGYSSLSQQMSEIELSGQSIAVFAVRASAIISGVSIVLFSFALWGRKPARLGFTAFTAFLFGVSMMSNGFFIMGGPMHGLYGIGIFMVLTPAFFSVEFRHGERFPRLALICMTFAILSLVYMWLMISRLDPSGFQGLTQRIATIFMFGWYSIASYVLLREGDLETAPRHRATAAAQS